MTDNETRTAASNAARVAASYYIWSNEHRAWWGPARMGYTTDLEQAGVYSRREAIRICEQATLGWNNPEKPPPEIPVSIIDALEALSGWLSRVKAPRVT